MNDLEIEAWEELEEATKSLDAAADGSKIEQMRKESQIIDELSDTLADLFLDGLQVQESRFASAISDSSTLNKTEAKNLITRKVREKESDENRLVDEWIADNLSEVRVIQTTDHISDTRYVWDYGGVTVETGSGRGERTHFQWLDYRDEIYEAGGPYLDDPAPDHRDGDGWRDFIVRQIDQHETIKESLGPRSRATEYLKTRIRNADGFGQLADAADYQGVFAEVTDEAPEDESPVDTETPQQECPLWRVDLLMVPNDWAKSAAEEYDITTRAVQNELEARGYTLDGRRVSSTEYVDGRYQTFWKLNGTFAAPAAYQPDADADEDRDDTDSDTQSDTDSDGDGSDHDEDEDEGNFGTIGGDL
jgi:hypothetical protein